MFIISDIADSITNPLLLSTKDTELLSKGLITKICIYRQDKTQILPLVLIISNASKSFLY